MFYFCQAPGPPPKTAEEAEQSVRVATFRDSVAKRALIWEYGEHSEFKSVVRPHILTAVSRSIHEQGRASVPTLPLPTQVSTDLRQRLLSYAAEYQSIRDRMEPGDKRTRQMELVATKIRTLALQGQSLLPAFSVALTPGERLIAAAFLQVLPRADYLEWLSERLSEKQPFLAYHAAVALLAAARFLDCSLRDSMYAAINEGFRRLQSMRVSENTDRFRTLSAARGELDIRCGG
jgi:hypothetical protein